MREMKDSGIAWIGEIPLYWDCIRLKDKWTNKKEIAGNRSDQYARLALTLGGVIERPKDDVDGLQPKDFVSYQILHKNDFVFKMIDLKNYSTSRVGLSFHTGLVSPAYIRFVPNSDVQCFKFTYYFLMSMYYFHVYNSIGDDGVRSSLSASDIGNFYIPWPCWSEQNTIANFLDDKCAEIDALSSNIQAQIETLEQYKRSVISEAVTRGLDPNVPMKDSGITWVKQIPKHWAVIPSKYLFHNSDTRKYPGDEQLTASQRHGIITQREYMERENAKVVFATQGLDNWKHVKPNDFVISLRSFQGGLEMSETTGCITWHYVVLEASKPIYPPFYKWLFKSVQYINALQGTCNFIRDGQDLRFSNFSKVPLYEPPMDEQKAIADYLDAKCAEIDQTIAQKQEQLDTLADYKKSLIYEYVTGKKEVPGS